MRGNEFTTTFSVPPDCSERLSAALSAYNVSPASMVWRNAQLKRVDALQAAANQNFRNALYQLQTRDRIYDAHNVLTETEAMQADQSAVEACGAWLAIAGVCGSFPEEKS